MRPLLVLEAGSFIGKRSERIVVREKDQSVLELPFFRVAEVVVGRRGVTLSTDFIEEAVRRGIRITFLGTKGTPYATLCSPHLVGTIKTRRAQLEAYRDGRGLAFGAAVVAAKLKNQANLVKYFGKHVKQKDPEAWSGLAALGKGIEARRRSVRALAGESVDAVRPTLLGLEGEGGNLYWRAVVLLLRRTDFVARQHRGATDPVNALLNYGYGILESRVTGAVLGAGLDPFAGFLHVDRPGRPSLVLDLMEEFRQPVVDRSVVALLNQGTAVSLTGGLLDTASRRAIAERVLERLESEVEHRGRRRRLTSVLQAQAHGLAAFLRGDPAARAYRGYAFRW